MRDALAGAAAVSDFLWSSATEDKVFPTVEAIAQLEAQLLKRLKAIGDRGLQFHLRRFVSDQTSALYWKHRRRRLPREGGGRQLSARLGAAENPWRAAAVLLAGVVNHPSIAADDVDRFVMIRSDDPGLARLAEAILGVIASQHDITGAELRRRLAGSASRPRSPPSSAPRSGRRRGFCTRARTLMTRRSAGGRSSPGRFCRKRAESWPPRPRSGSASRARRPGSGWNGSAGSSPSRTARPSWCRCSGTRSNAGARSLPPDRLTQIRGEF